MSRILVVEDNPMNRLLVNDLLSCRGHEVIEACNVNEAMRRLEENRPDLVLLDVGIPGGGGLSVLRMIRADERTASLPVVAVTAFAMLEDRARFLASGFDGYVSKPIDTRSFGLTVEGFVPKVEAR